MSGFRLSSINAITFKGYIKHWHYYGCSSLLKDTSNNTVAMAVHTITKVVWCPLALLPNLQNQMPPVKRYIRNSWQFLFQFVKLCTVVRCKSLQDNWSNLVTVSARKYVHEIIVLCCDRVILQFLWLNYLYFVRLLHWHRELFWLFQGPWSDPDEYEQNWSLPIPKNNITQRCTYMTHWVCI